MTLLVTGATGFVMSVLARHWLETDPAARLVVLDAAPLDAAAQRYFAPVKQRLSVVVVICFIDARTFGQYVRNRSGRSLSIL